MNIKTTIYPVAYAGIPSSDTMDIFEDYATAEQNTVVDIETVVSALNEKGNLSKPEQEVLSLCEKAAKQGAGDLIVWRE